jgi:hypothetical protein
MKFPLLFVTLAIFVSSAAAQQRPRILDNFNIAKGVTVHRTEFIPVGAKNKPTKNSNTNGRITVVNSSKLSTTGKPLVQPTGSSSPVKQPKRTVRMDVGEGLADREMAKASMMNNNIRVSGAVSGMRGFTTGSPVYDSYIVDSSRKYGIDPLLIYSQMHQESSFKLKALSNKGASGLMQLMPATARRLGVTNIYDPKQNIEGGVKYMRMLLDMFGQDVRLALAGYNAGEGAVMKYGNNIPPYNETREYVRRISARYASISDGSFARNYRKVSPAQVAKLSQKPSRPLAIYEPDVVVVRSADGRMRLVNQ